MEKQIKTVEDILLQLDLKNIPCILAFNKTDLIPHEEAVAFAQRMDGMPISAINRHSLSPLLSRIEEFLWDQQH
jgi:GTPase